MEIKATTVLLWLAALIGASISVRADPSTPKATCLPPNERFDCHPETGPSQERCETRGCCWDRTRREQPNVPSCSFPADFGGYRTINVTSTATGLLAFMARSFPSPYLKDVPLLRVDSEFLTDYILRVKISDPTAKRFEAPYPQIQNVSVKNVSPTYSVTFDESKAGFQVSRLTGEVVFNSLNVGALTYADQFLEISTLLSEDTRLHGIGEHRTNLTIKPEWKRYTLFNHDSGPTEDTNLYGSHPFYIATDSSGLSHGVFLHNSNPMDILVSPQPALTFRTIGGILDFYFFLGPRPEDVVKQYTSLIGRSLMPPYWSLGFHLCRYGYGSTNRTREVWMRNRALQIPFDAQWNDIDYMIAQNDFTVNPVEYAGLSDFVDEVHNVGMHYVPIVDPGVSGSEPAGTYPPFDLGVEQDVLVKTKNGSILFGRVWNRVSTAWPDFTHPGVQAYWNQLLSDFHDQVAFDGIWIDMNEPASGVDGSLDGCPQDELENPPYSPGVEGDKLSFRTMCMNAQHAAGSHYNIHNLYSIAEADVTNQALRNLGKRPFVISRSTFSGSGRYTGHWSGDDVATWYDLAKSIQELLTFNMYGVSLMGADICGFRGDTNQQLCNRWFQLGAFYTFCRNHNDLGLIDQDPAVFDSATISSIRKSLNTRYTLLPYLYTLFFQSNAGGSTVARPLFFEFPEDPKAYEVELAFLWGRALYIVPVVDEGAEAVQTYLPAGRWFDWYSGAERNSSGETVVLDAPYDTIPVLLRGGSIIPTQAPEVTTTLSRKNGITLVAAPSGHDGVVSGSAEGLFYWDDGEVIDPVENNVFGLVAVNLQDYARVSTQVQFWNTTDIPNIEGLRVMGMPCGCVNNATVNGVPNATATIDDNRVLHIDGFSVPANIEVKISWNCC